MISIAWAFELLSGAALMSLLVSAIGSAAALICREPVRQMQIITVTLAACVLAPLFALVPGLPRWSIPEWQPTMGTAGVTPQVSAIDIRVADNEQTAEAAPAVKASGNA